MEIKIKKKLSKVLSKSLCEEIYSETRLKFEQYKKIKQKNQVDIYWISNDQFIFDLILLSIFFRRVIFPMQETIKFYNLINEDSGFHSDKMVSQGNREFIRKKIVIGAKKIGSGDEDIKFEVNIEELQKIIDDFDSVLKILNMPSKVLLYKSIDEFLENLKPLVGETK